MKRQKVSRVVLFVLFSIVSVNVFAASNSKEDNEYAEYFDRKENQQKARQAYELKNQYAVEPKNQQIFAPKMTQKAIQFGLSRASFEVTNDLEAFDNDVAVGLEGYVAILFTNNFKFRLGMANLAVSESGPDVFSMNTNFLLGTNFQRTGFSFFVGPGFYSDDWSGVQGRQFNGWHLSIGCGQNWDNVSLEALWSARDASSYKSFISDATNQNVNVTSSAFAISISGRW
jgi:hypothetical protein